MKLEEAIEIMERILKVAEIQAGLTYNLDAFSLVLEAARKQLDWHTVDCTTCNNQKGKWGWEPCDHCVRHASNNWTPKEENT